MRCPKCGDEHEYDKCPGNTVLKYCNCGGLHSAAYGGFEEQIKAREVQKNKVENKVTHAQALKDCGSSDDKQKEMIVKDKPDTLEREKKRQKETNAVINILSKKTH